MIRHPLQAGNGGFTPERSPPQHSGGEDEHWVVHALLWALDNAGKGLARTWLVVLGRVDALLDVVVSFSPLRTALRLTNAYFLIKVRHVTCLGVGCTHLRPLHSTGALHCAVAIAPWDVQLECSILFAGTSCVPCSPR